MLGFRVSTAVKALKFAHAMSALTPVLWMALKTSSPAPLQIAQ
jgi:hypothetical protein